MYYKKVELAASSDYFITVGKINGFSLVVVPLLLLLQDLVKDSI